ncbi:MAG: sulfatase-like hydrolase/transferase, partial [Planctomycetales bacterium]|nr:sulfatase-like hydrolase/transferase [Planctomycetales bacterium]
CIDTWIGRSMMDPEEVTIAEHLSAAGYSTGIFGKWHLGDCYPMRPMDQGFQESLVLNGGGLAQPSEPRENNARYTDPILFRNGQQEQTKGYCADVYFREAINFIGDSVSTQRPFFVYIPSNTPHGPFHDVPEDLRKQYAAEPDKLASIAKEPVNDGVIDRLARIGAMVTNVDHNVGRLLDALDDLKIADNTIVIYLVDNGPNSWRYVGNRRGMKTGVNEGGVRSPFWIRWPNRLKAGTVSEKLSAHIDVLPTIAAACNVDISNGPKIDGRNLLPLLDGSKNIDWPERTIAIQTHRGDVPTRYHHFMIRDSRWKLLHASGFGNERFSGEPTFELFDVLDDPTESKNVIASHPDEFSRLRDAYDKWFDDVSSTRPDNYAPPRIHLGHDGIDSTMLTRQDWRAPSWSDKHIGHWEVHVEKELAADVRVLITPVDRAEEVALAIGDQVVRGESSPNDDEVLLKGVRMLAGDARIRVTLSSNGMQRGPHQVIVENVK